METDRLTGSSVLCCVVLGGVRGATVVTDTPVVLRCRTSLPHNSWRSETSSYAEAENVPQDLRFRVVVDGDMSGRFGFTGGVEDGVDNSGLSKEKLRGCVHVWRELSPISGVFTMAAAFSNVNGVYSFWANSHEFASQEVCHENPLSFFHDGAS